MRILKYGFVIFIGYFNPILSEFEGNEGISLSKIRPERNLIKTCRYAIVSFSRERERHHQGKEILNDGKDL